MVGTRQPQGSAENPVTRPRLPSTVNRPRGAKSGLTAKAREILDRTKREIAKRSKK